MPFYNGRMWTFPRITWVSRETPSPSYNAGLAKAANVAQSFDARAPVRVIRRPVISFGIRLNTL